SAYAAAEPDAEEDDQPPKPLWRGHESGAEGSSGRPDSPSSEEDAKTRRTAGESPMRQSRQSYAQRGIGAEVDDRDDDEQHANAEVCPRVAKARDDLAAQAVSGAGLRARGCPERGQHQDQYKADREKRGVAGESPPCSECGDDKASEHRPDDDSGLRGHIQDGVAR